MRQQGLEIVKLALSFVNSIVNISFKVSPQTQHTIESVFTPFGLPGVPFSIEEEVLDLALIKLGNVLDQSRV